MSFFKRKKPRNKVIPNITPEAIEAQKVASQQFTQQFPDFFQSLGFDPEATRATFDQTVAGPARQQFAEQTAPQIQERAIGMGAGRSSALDRQLSTAGENLESNLSGQLTGQLSTEKKTAQELQLEALMKALGLGSGAVGEGFAVPGKLSGFESGVGSVQKAVTKLLRII